MFSTAFVLQVETSLRALAAARSSALDAKNAKFCFLEEPKIAKCLFLEDHKRCQKLTLICLTFKSTLF